MVRRIVFCSVAAATSVFAAQVSTAAPGLDATSAVAPYLDGAFPATSPGSADGEWVQVDYYPDLTFVEPIRIIEHPIQDRLIILGKDGLAHSVSHQPGATDKTLFMNLQPRIIRKANNGEGGISDLVFHPDFANNGYVYVSHRFNPDRQGEVDTSNNVPGYNRLSRFTVVGGVVDIGSELELISQYDRGQFHIGGDMFFGSDGFLYISAGDEGGGGQFASQVQRVDGALLSGILRIDVDMDPNRSHPIRRQPAQVSENPASNPASNGPNWFPSRTMNYFIPDDNPFVDPTGGQLEEFYSIGLRHPWTIAFDQPTGNIFAADVGSNLHEEVNLIRPGDNHQWAYMEGPDESPRLARPQTIIGNEAPPIISYPRSVGQAIIGAGVYRGEKFPELFGRYLYSDFVNGQLWAAAPVGNSWQTEQISTITSGFPNGINSYLLDTKGNILMARTSGSLNPNGRIEMLVRAADAVVAPEPPQLLSNTGAFQNLASLTPNAGCIPYDLNVPFWSDGALKARWMCIPNDGIPNSASEQIGFSEEGDWIFPVGSVLIKHFELQTNHSNPNSAVRLETRFIVHGEDGYYGVTYRWNNAGTEATLLTSSETRNFQINTADGSFNQTWLFPSRGDCLTCHTETAGGVLGPNTRQLNRNLLYPETGRTGNQLESLNAVGLLRPSIDVADIQDYLTSSPTLDESLSLAARARSYLDANCSYCHMPNGVRANFDARLTTPIGDQGLINGMLNEDLGIGGAKVIVPGNLFSSVLLHRVDSLGENAMPPIAKDVVDEDGVSLLTDWILAMNNLEVGNVASADGNNIDGHHPSLYINEEDVFVHDNAAGTVYVQNFSFYARREGNPVTPVVVRVNGNDDFTVVAIGTTRTSQEYTVGENVFRFNDSGAVPLVLAAGEALAMGFMDSFPDGTGWGAGTVIPAAHFGTANNNPNNQDEIWALLPFPLLNQSNGFAPNMVVPTISPGQHLSNASATAGLQALTELRRNYRFNISLSLVNDGDAVNSPGGDAQIENGSFESPIVNLFTVFSNPNAIPGWTITGGSVEIDRTPWPASDGQQSMDLSGTVAGSLEQTVGGFAPGASYELLFDYGLHASAKSARSANVLIDGNIADTVTAGTGMLVPNYQTARVPFVAAQSGQHTIGISSLSSDSLGVVIDNVRLSLTGLPSPTPPPVPLQCNATSNIALGGSASQSSNGGGTSFPANNAIDGNLGNFTHTDLNQAPASWQVTLDEDSVIEQVVLHNRDNCCGSRLRDITVTILNSSGGVTYQSALLNPENTLNAPSFITVNLPQPVTGSVIQVQRTPDSDGSGGAGSAADITVLSLGEVQVNGCALGDSTNTPQNLAQNQPVTQSSTGFDGAAARAVDGNTNGTYNAGSVTHTQGDSQNPWWRVDLGATYDVSQINVFNRTDSCCNSRLNGATVYVGNVNSTNPSDYTVVGTLSGSTSVQSLTGVSTAGRYVMVRIAGQGTLSLAEVQVFGETTGGGAPGGGSGVTFYQDGNFGGASWTVGAGRYEFPVVNSSPVGNDNISSIDIPAGFSVVACQHGGFAGVCNTYTSSVSFLTDFNDDISSVEVFRN